MLLLVLGPLALVVLVLVLVRRPWGLAGSNPRSPLRPLSMLPLMHLLAPMLPFFMPVLVVMLALVLVLLALHGYCSSIQVERLLMKMDATRLDRDSIDPHRPALLF